MNRFFGLMPCNEVEKHKTFKDSSGLPVTIEAGPNGWTIMWADHSTTYGDIRDTTEHNFQRAYDTAEMAVGELKG